MWQQNLVQFGVMPWLISWGSFFLSLCSQRALLCPNLPPPPTLQFVAAAEEMTGLFQVSHGALTSTTLCLLSRKWHTRLAKPAWFHLRALDFSHALISDWLKWRAVTTKLGTKLTDSRYPGYLLMLGGQKINSAVNLGLWTERVSVSVMVKKKKDPPIWVRGYCSLLPSSHQPTQGRVIFS